MESNERFCIWRDYSGAWIPDCKDSITNWQIETAAGIYSDITAGFCPWCGERIAITDVTGTTILGKRVDHGGTC